MNSKLNFVFYNDHGLRAGWRLLIFCSMIAIIAVAVELLVAKMGPGPASKTASGYLVPLASGLGELVPFLLLLFLCWVMSYIERRPIGEYGLPLRKLAFSRFCLGYLFWGFFPLSVLLLLMRALHLFYFGDLALHGSSMISWGLAWGFVFLAVGLFEEFSFRGYVLYTLADGIGFWPAAIILALVFACAHMSNGGETRLGVVATAIFALFAASTIRKTGDLWLAVGAHAGWDWGETFFYGVNDSGFQAPGHLLKPHVPSGAPDWLTGGSVGPEGSLLTFLLWGLMLMLFLVGYRRRKARLPASAPASTPAV